MFHRWISTDDPAHDACLTCGGMWARVPLAGRHASIDGMPATHCTGNTTQCHHYPGECPEIDDCNIDVDCNCLLCYS